MRLNTDGSVSSFIYISNNHHYLQDYNNSHSNIYKHQKKKKSFGEVPTNRSQPNQDNTTVCKSPGVSVSKPDLSGWGFCASGAEGEGMLQSWVIFPGLGDSFPWGISHESPAWVLVLVLLQWSRSYSSCAFCIFRFFIFLLWMWKVIRERRIRQQMRATKTIKTKVDEKDWKNCPICVMQVLLALEVPDVLFKRQGGRERLDPLDSSALIEEGRFAWFPSP